ncbi:hypothetical protein [Burkholderia ubonensis]|uniref:DUF7079 family protein n=1 Tax=Burkholderia ubonensis TaxID=101571 RepID=UPI00075BF3CE|nr:hypothetical protein [Burkholderia ubonensis]KVP17353.1 hypothetical protein WJ84_03740 [Burkholderia ubonensis]KVP39526.1 hypothetical protein WJ87_04630 [Burkholderia ubonensis]
MSDLFVDNEVDYRHVAEQLTRHCPNMTIPLLKEAFFGEVAPQLASNGMTPAPSVWTEFDSDQVVDSISSMLSRRQTSLFYRVGNSLWRFICRRLCNDMWRKLEQELLLVSRQAGV